jgi:hypothetical protein
MFDQIARKYGVMNYAMGGPVMMAEGGLTTEELRAQIEAGPRTQAALDQALLKYSPAQMAAAFPEYGGVADYNNATREAFFRVEQQERAASRAAMRDDMARTGETFRLTGNDSTPPQFKFAQFPTMSAIPQSEIDAARARLTPEQQNFIDWQMEQTDPMQHMLIKDQYARQGVNPYLNPSRAQEQIDRAQRRADMFAQAGVTPTVNLAEWNDPNWREKLEAERQARAAEQERSRQNPGPFVIGGGTGAGGGGTVPGPSSGGGGPVVGPGGGTTPPPGGGGTPPGPGPGQPPPFTPPPVYQPPAPFTGPSGTIFPNSIQTPQGPQPTYFPTSWWTSSPTASNAYGRTTGSTARNFDSEMADYRANFAPVFTRPTPPPPISGPAIGQDPNNPPSESAGFAKQWVWEGDRWVAKPNGASSETNTPVVEAAQGGEVNKLWKKYHGR